MSDRTKKAVNKRWTQKEDEHIVAYLDLVGPFLGPDDLGRSAKSVSGRAGFLRKSGAWAAIERKWKAEHDYRMAVDPIYARMAEREKAAGADLDEILGKRPNSKFIERPALRVVK